LILKVHIYHIHSKEASVCPICGGHLHVIGSKPRKVIESSGEVKILIIRRLRCRECGKIHHELPDILIPYKRHCAETIEKIISAGKTAEVPCEESTIRKISAWWTALLPYFINVINSLSAKLQITFSSTMTPREIIRAVVNAHFWIHTRSACLSG